MSETAREATPAFEAIEKTAPLARRYEVRGRPEYHAYRDGLIDGYWKGKEAALSTLPTMTSAQLMDLINEHTLADENVRNLSVENQRWHPPTRNLANALIARFPHLLTPEPLVKPGEAK